MPRIANELSQDQQDAIRDLCTRSHPAHIVKTLIEFCDSEAGFCLSTIGQQNEARQWARASNKLLVALDELKET